MNNINSRLTIQPKGEVYEHSPKHPQWGRFADTLKRG